VLAVKKASMQTTSSYQVMANDPKLLALEEFDDLYDVVCETFIVLTGEHLKFPLPHYWERGYYREYSLVINGESDCGKTQVALSIAAWIAQKQQEKMNYQPYFIKVGTVDSLRDCVSQGLMRANVPIVLDEVKLGAPRGGSQGTATLEDGKRLLESASSSNVGARHHDVPLHEDQPKIFTSNAMSPNGWHRDLPIDVFEQTPQQRLQYCADVKAIFKRAVFANVRSSLISADLRRSYREARFGNGASSSSSSSALPHRG